MKHAYLSVHISTKAPTCLASRSVSATAGSSESLAGRVISSSPDPSSDGLPLLTARRGLTATSTISSSCSIISKPVSNDEGAVSSDMLSCLSPIFHRLALTANHYQLFLLTTRQSNSSIQPSNIKYRALINYFTLSLCHFHGVNKVQR